MIPTFRPDALVFIARPDDPNLGVILETSTRHETRPILAQTYLTEAAEGDKRIILVDGEPVGACLRVPTGVDHRGNIHVGARVEACGEAGLSEAALSGP